MSLIRGSLIGSLILASASIVYAQERKEIQPRRADAKVGVEIHRVSSVIGTTVSLRGNTSLGKIDDIVLNDNGCVDYLVVAYDDKFVLVPWSSARVDFGNRTVTVDIERDRFRDAPTFTREAWPDLSDSKYVDKVYKFYGAKPGRVRGEERREDRRERRDKPPQ
jgi:hypothetical protein